jgi:hypothetical protein
MTAANESSTSPPICRVRWASRFATRQSSARSASTRSCGRAPRSNLGGRIACGARAAAGVAGHRTNALPGRHPEPGRHLGTRSANLRAAHGLAGPSHEKGWCTTASCGRRTPPARDAQVWRNSGLWPRARRALPSDSYGHPPLRRRVAACVRKQPREGRLRRVLTTGFLGLCCRNDPDQRHRRPRGLRRHVLPGMVLLGLCSGADPPGDRQRVAARGDRSGRLFGLRAADRDAAPCSASAVCMPATAPVIRSSSRRSSHNHPRDLTSAASRGLPFRRGWHRSWRERPLCG